MPAIDKPTASAGSGPDAPAGFGEPYELMTPDGRRLRCFAAGRRGDPLVIYHHGTPACGLLARQWVDDASRRGLRLVSSSRPGYDRSVRQAGRAVADAAADAATVADAEGADTFVTWGASGGGPHALACAALLPDRVSRVASVAGVAPYVADGSDELDWLAGMGENNEIEFGATLAGEDRLRALLESWQHGFTGGIEEMVEGMASLLPPVDREALRRGWGEFMHVSTEIGLAPGIEGWLDDDLAFVQPWGFDLAAMTTPVLITQGSEDLMVPAAHGEWLAAHVPGAQVTRRDGEGHLSLLDHLDAVYDWLRAD